MSEHNLKVWDAVCRPDPKHLKPIQFGRLKGKSDINPQWRVKCMTETFGPCGVGWKWTIDRLWTEPGADGEVMAFAQVSVFIKTPEAADCKGDQRDMRYWSAPIPGVGGSTLIAKEKNGLYNNDEAFKMAVTDALGTAMKMLGVAADIYLGNFDGSKYLTPSADEEREQEAKNRAQEDARKKMLQDAERTGMAILIVAADKGHKSLELAWKTLTQTCRDACKSKWGELKQRALAVDAEMEEANATGHNGSTR